MNMFKEFLLGKERNKGTAAIEFGLIAPILIVAVVGLFQVGLIMVAQNSIDVAAREASRFGVTGLAAQGVSRDSAIRQKIYDTAAAFSGGIIDPNKLTIIVTAYRNLESIGQPEPLLTDLNANGEWDIGDTYIDVNGNAQWDIDQGVSNSYGIAGETVLYIINYEMDTILSLFGVNGKITLTGQAPVVNEDF